MNTRARKVPVTILLLTCAFYVTCSCTKNASKNTPSQERGKRMKKKKEREKHSEPGKRHRAKTYFVIQKPLEVAFDASFSLSFIHSATIAFANWQCRVAPLCPLSLFAASFCHSFRSFSRTSSHLLNFISSSSFFFSLSLALSSSSPPPFMASSFLRFLFPPCFLTFSSPGPFFTGSLCLCLVAPWSKCLFSHSYASSCLHKKEASFDCSDDQASKSQAKMHSILGVHFNEQRDTVTSTKPFRKLRLVSLYLLSHSLHSSLTRFHRAASFREHNFASQCLYAPSPPHSWFFASRCLPLPVTHTLSLGSLSFFFFI